MRIAYPGRYRPKSDIRMRGASGLETLPIGSIGIATAEALRAVRLLVAPTSTSRPNPMPKMGPRTDQTAPVGGTRPAQLSSVRKVNMEISLAFIAPDLVRAAIEGRLPHG